MALSHSLVRHLRPLANSTRILRSTTNGSNVLGNQSSRRTAPIALVLQSRWQSGPPQPPSAGGASDYQYGPANDLQPQPHTQHKGDEDHGSPRGNATGEAGEGGGDGKGAGTHSNTAGTAWKMFESAATTAASLSILGLAGYGYHKYYKHLVLQKIDNAFNQGDPALNLARAGHNDPWVELKQQARLNDIIDGNDHGHYYLLIGEKGTGKTSMLLSAMHRTQGEACSMMEAHADPEIFRLRLGKALDFEFHEDYIGSLFSIRGPRETTALLDIERAFNKLEKVALMRRKKTGKPLVMIINGMHMIHDDEVGRDLLELLQQRAEGWAAAGLVTMVFNSDDYWVYERMKQYGSRMELIAVRDLSKQQAIKALKVLRRKTRFALPEDEQLFSQVYDLVGGRLAFLTKVAKSENMLRKCHAICQAEKTWFLSQCWILGMEMDDDVMNQQKYASSAMLLVKALVDKENEEGAKSSDGKFAEKLPSIPMHEARQIMTRADFVQQYDHHNIFTIDSKAMVRADSVPMMHAFRDIVNENVDDKSFAVFLEETMERISDIESLGRTREVTLKDLWNGGKYNFTVKDSKGRTDKTLTFDVSRGFKGIHGDETEGDDDDDEEGNTKK